MAPLQEWTALHADVLVKVIAEADDIDLASVRLVCKSWSRAVASHLPQLKPLQLPSGALHVFKGVTSLDLSVCKQQLWGPAVLGVQEHCKPPESGSSRLCEARHEQQACSAALARLRSLKVHSSSLVSTGVAQLVHLSGVKELCIEDSRALDVQQLHDIVSGLQQLTRLEFGCDLHGILDRPPEAVHDLRLLPPLPGGLRRFRDDGVFDTRPDSLARLLACTGLRSLSLGCGTRPVDGRGVRLLAALTGLTELRIRSTPDMRWTYGRAVGAGDVAGLAALRELRVFELKGCRDDCEPRLLGMRTLTALEELTLDARGDKAPYKDYRPFWAISVSTRILSCFALARLTRLKLYGPLAGTGSLEGLQAATCLRSLDLQNLFELPVSTLSVLSRLTTLRSLSVTDSCFMDLGSPMAQGWLRPLSALTNLELSVQYYGVPLVCSSAAHKEFAGLWTGLDGLTRLERLVARRQLAYDLADSGPALSTLTGLRELTVCSDRSDGAPEQAGKLIAGVAALTGLRSLCLQEFTLDRNAFATLRQLKLVTSLKLSIYGGEDLTALQGIGSLRTLDLSCHHEAPGLASVNVADIAVLTELRSLTVCALEPTPASLAALASLPALRHLDASCNRRLGKDALPCLRGFTALVTLDLRTQMTRRFARRPPRSDLAHVAILQAELPLLRSVHLEVQDDDFDAAYRQGWRALQEPVRWLQDNLTSAKRRLLSASA